MWEALDICDDILNIWIICAEKEEEEQRVLILPKKLRIGYYSLTDAGGAAVSVTLQ